MSKKPDGTKKRLLRLDTSNCLESNLTFKLFKRAALDKMQQLASTPQQHLPSHELSKEESADPAHFYVHDPDSQKTAPISKITRAFNVLGREERNFDLGFAKKLTSIQRSRLAFKYLEMENDPKRYSYYQNVVPELVRKEDEGEASPASPLKKPSPAKPIRESKRDIYFKKQAEKMLHRRGLELRNSTAETKTLTDGSVE